MALGYSAAIEAQLKALEWLRHNKIKGLNPQQLKIDETMMRAAEHSLEYGDTYYWPREFCELLQREGAQFPVEWAPYQEEFLGESGFTFLEKPIFLPPKSLQIPNEASLREAIALAKEANGEVRDFWLSGDYVPPDRAEELVGSYVGSDHKLDERIGDMTPMFAFSWVWTVNQAHNQPAVLFVFYIREGNTLIPHGLSLIPEGQDLKTTMEAQKELRGSAALWFATRFSCCAVAFQGQRIFSHNRERPDRATRRRIEHWRPEPLVSVIQLRRVHKISHNNEHIEQDWQFQWMVRGHWRRQWYPKLQRHQTIWVAPYIKGPDNKPFKQPKAKVYAVVR